MAKPFCQFLPGRTIADLQAGSAPAVSFREQRRRHPRFHLKTTEQALVLRCWASNREPGWSLKAVMHPEAQGVRLDGRIHARIELLIISFFSGLAVVMATIGVAGVSLHQQAAGFPLSGALLFLALAALLIRKRRAAMGERSALAWLYLQSLQPLRQHQSGRPRTGRSAS